MGDSRTNDLVAFQNLIFYAFLQRCSRVSMKHVKWYWHLAGLAFKPA